MHTSQLNPTIFLKDLLKIPSPSGNEEKIAQYLQKFLEKNGFNLISSNVGNVIGVKGQGNPILLLASHIDTIHSECAYREEDDRIFCRGAIDCKPALAAIFYSCAAIDLASFPGTIIVAGLVQEEVSLVGVEDLFKSLAEIKLIPDAAVFGEPTQIDRICIGYRGRVAIKVHAFASSGHSSNPWEYDNLIELNNIFYQKLQEYCLDFNQKSKFQGHFSELTATITSIHAGDLDNTLSSKLNANIDIRLPPGITHEDVVKSIQGILLELKTKIKQPTSTEFKISITSKYDAVEIENETPVLSAFRWAAFQVLQKKVGLVKKTGSTFTNIIQTYYIKQNPNFRCITYGPGDPRLEHTDQEWVSIPDYLKAIEIYQKFFPKYLDLFSKFDKKIQS